MLTGYQNNENLIDKMESYIDANKHWFCVGVDSLIQIAKDEQTNMFKIRTNTQNYNQALENFLNNQEIEFDDWKLIQRSELSDIIDRNRTNIDFQFNNFR